MQRPSNRSKLLFASIKAVFKKEVLQLARTPVVVTFAFLIPTIELLLLGYMLDINVRQIRTVVYDLSVSQESKRLLDEFVSTNDFQIVKIAHSDKEIYDTITAGEAKVAIKIPVDYARQNLDGRTATVQILVDGSNANITAEAVSVTNRLMLQESVRRLLAGADSNLPQVASGVANTNSPTHPVETRSSILFNPASRSSNFFLPGLLVWEIPGIAILLMAVSMAGERQKGTMDQLATTPINPAGLLIGKILPYAILAFLLLCELFLLMRFVFNVPVHGSILLLLLMSIPFIITDLGIGLIISSKLTTEIEAMQIGLIFRVFPPFYMTGYIFPLESANQFFQTITKFVPERYYTEISRGIILRGAGIEHLWFQALVLCIMSVVTMGIAILIYRKKLS